ncbi:chromate efflux transporter [Alcanivorax marinus]|uniref:Chromate efflux transporter n=2 Tax=Alloalcanivorax marinus TaxID=1177169 RepID=A0A9Q3UNL9_9GAMM|nr:chromate efflux transporter [Alloalcanivorax marinus]MCC4308692.1 chromate efflux transporter [Alloalcanivorax marinus]
MWTVFREFLWLGCVSFGGPAAHVGYFHRRFVTGLGWLDEATFARLMALTQFLPGPASSQLGFAIGRHRAGLPGAVAAFVAFTLPSFLLMLALAVYAARLPDTVLDGLARGLKWLAVVVVADAVLTLGGKFCRDGPTRALALATAVLLWAWPGIGTQLLALLAAALIGLTWRRGGEPPATDGTATPRRGPLLAFALIAGLLWLLPGAGLAGLARDFYSAGALVFGGGHVVLPLLQGLVGERLTEDAFLTGYAAAQAVPGPMFSLAAYLGALLAPGPAWLGALTAALAIFLPGFLLVLGLADAWQRLAARPALAGAVAGLNAAVVGLLLAALYDPVFRSAVQGGVDLVMVGVGFLLLRWGRVPLVWLVVGMAGFGLVVELV